jgi:Protein of unknown function (DUF3775)
MTGVNPIREPIDIDLTISTEQVCFIIIKAREYEVKEGSVMPESSSNSTDDGMTEVLERGRGDSVYTEISSFIRAMSEDEQIDLVALMWTGRGDFDVTEWDQTREEAAGQHNNRTAAYLLGTPRLAGYLVEALSAMGRSCQDVEARHL